MTDNLIKHKAHKILLQNKLYSLTDYNNLKRVVESNQFTIIEYKKHKNSENVSELIEKLRVENEIQLNDSFLYVRNNLRFLFINSDVSYEDKCSLLRHELGHIYDPDLKNSDINYSKIKKEEFANEFSYYIKNPGIKFKLYVFMMKKWKLLISIIMLIAFVLGFSYTINSLIIQPTKAVTTDISSNKNSADTYYVTSGGKKYHRKFCFTVKYKTNLKECTIDEAKNAGYKPCMVCLPDQE